MHIKYPCPNDNRDEGKGWGGEFYVNFASSILCVCLCHLCSWCCFEEKLGCFTVYAFSWLTYTRCIKHSLLNLAQRLFWELYSLTLGLIWLLDWPITSTPSLWSYFNECMLLLSSSLKIGSSKRLEHDPNNCLRNSDWMLCAIKFFQNCCLPFPIPLIITSFFLGTNMFFKLLPAWGSFHKAHLLILC